MDSILNEIYKLRKGTPMSIDRSNRNRYRLVTFEEDGSQTAYYFGVPIYHDANRKLLDMKFQNHGGNAYLGGSNSNIVVGDTIVLENRQGSCQITMSKGYRMNDERCISYDGTEVYPTTNGIACKVYLDAEKAYRFLLKTGKPFYQIRHNNKYFALMREKFQPLITVSCIGSLYQTGEIFAPAEITYQKVNDSEYELAVVSNSIYAKQILFEVNLQEEKLFQDTTVESKNPNQNNAFGGVAFIGNSSSFGEQWLYSRLDFSKLNDLFDRFIQKAVLHIPVLNQSEMKLSAVELSTRFCSFGSNWNNKKSGTSNTNVSETVAGYQTIHITNMITQNHRLLTTSEGWIIKSAVKNSGFSVLSTGDCFYAPQILEIRFR